MADLKKIKLPNNTVLDIKDSRITGVDSSPTSGSGNVITSGGVYTALSSKPICVVTVPSENTYSYDLDGTTSLPSGTYNALVAGLNQGSLTALRLYSVDGYWMYYIASWDSSADDFITLFSISSGTYFTFTLQDSEDVIVKEFGTIERTENKVTSISSSSTNIQYPSAKCTYDEVHPAVDTSQPAGGMLPNKFYNFGTLGSNTTFTFATPADANILNHYYWAFDIGSTARTITWPSEITKWRGGSAPTINTNKHYEVSVINGVGIFVEI